MFQQCAWIPLWYGYHIIRTACSMSCQKWVIEHTIHIYTHYIEIHIYASYPWQLSLVVNHQQMLYEIHHDPLLIQLIYYIHVCMYVRICVEK